MFDEIKKNVRKVVDGIDVLNIDDITEYGNKKLSLTISNDNFIASYEILDNMTYDYLLIRIEDENLIKTHTLYFDDFNLLLHQVNEDVILLKNM